MTYMRDTLPSREHTGHMLKNVAVLVLDGFSPFELGVVCEVFGTDRSDDGLPAYDFAVVAGQPGPLRSETGFTLQTPFGLERIKEADLIAVPAMRDDVARSASAQFPDPLLSALRYTVGRRARVLNICPGAFILVPAAPLPAPRSA